MADIHRIVSGNVNCYIVADNGRAILIDTGRTKYREKILEKCKEFHVSLIVLTHGHMDHCQNAAYLAGALQIPIAMSEKEDSLFVGDALMNMFYPTTSMLYTEEQEMLESAKYISELGEKTIYFGHGKPKRNRKWVK